MEKRMIYIIGGAIVLVLILLGVGIFVLLPQFNLSNSQATATPTVTTTPAATARKNIYAPYLQQYGSGIQAQIAQGLHLTSDQVAAQIKGGKTLSDIASAQGVSASQLQTLISNAFTSNLQPAVSAGALTTKQVNKLATNMQKNQKALDHFLMHKYSGTTPVGTPTAGAGA